LVLELRKIDVNLKCKSNKNNCKNKKKKCIDFEGCYFIDAKKVQ